MFTCTDRLNHSDILNLQLKYKDDQTVLDLIDYIIELETQYLYADEFADELDDD